MLQAVVLVLVSPAASPRRLCADCAACPQGAYLHVHFSSASRTLWTVRVFAALMATLACVELFSDAEIFVCKPHPEPLTDVALVHDTSEAFQVEVDLLLPYAKLPNVHTPDQPPARQQPHFALAVAMDLDQLTHLPSLVAVWQGPVSLALYVSDPTRIRSGEVSERVKTVLSELPWLAALSSVHLVAPFRVLGVQLDELRVPPSVQHVQAGGEQVPLGVLRNLAVHEARAQYVMVLDGWHAPMFSAHVLESMWTRLLASESRDLERMLLVVRKFEVPSSRMQALHSTCAAPDALVIDHDIPSPCLAELDKHVVKRYSSGYWEWSKALLDLTPLPDERWADHMYFAHKQFVPAYDEFLFGPQLNTAGHVLRARLHGARLTALPRLFAVGRSDMSPEPLHAHDCEASLYWNVFFLAHLRDEAKRLGVDATRLLAGATIQGEHCKGNI